MSNAVRIEEKKTLIGGKIFFRFNGNDYNTRAEAEAAAASYTAQQANEAAQRAEVEQRQRELVHLKESYAKDPEYRHVTVLAEFAGARSTLTGFFNFGSTGSGGIIEANDLTEKISDACCTLSLAGYEVTSIVDITSGVGFKGKTLGDGNFAFGYSFTSAVIITGKRRSSTSHAVQVGVA